MKPALLDVNVLAALMWPEHQHHAAAQAWAGSRGRANWATCPLTELGFLRLVMNPAFSRKALSFKNAIALLRQAVASDTHQFWHDTVSAGDAVEAIANRIQGHGQINDGYLLFLAKQHKGVLATFDSGIRSLAVADFASSLEIIPTA